MIELLMDLERRIDPEMANRTHMNGNSTVRTKSKRMASDEASMSDIGTPSLAAESNFIQAEELDEPRHCTVEELNALSHTGLLLMLNWAKGLPSFDQLITQDKVTLLRNFAAQHLILMPAFNSTDTCRLCFFNNTYINRSSDHLPNINNITPKILDEIVAPMREWNMSPEEFACLKAIVFFCPETKGLSTEAQDAISETRNDILRALHSHISVKYPIASLFTRYARILLLTPTIKALSQLLIENITLTKFFGLAKVDSLLAEFVLEDCSDVTG